MYILHPLSSFLSRLSTLVSLVSLVSLSCLSTLVSLPTPRVADLSSGRRLDLMKPAESRKPTATITSDRADLTTVHHLEVSLCLGWNPAEEIELTIEW